MITTAAMRRRLSPWLLGLFLAAQTFGLVPLMSDHTAHEAAIHLSASSGKIGPQSGPAHHHYRGDADGFVQHHELQDLNGAFISVIDGCDIALVFEAIREPASNALVGSDPVLPERPPKPFLAI